MPFQNAKTPSRRVTGGCHRTDGKPAQPDCSAGKPSARRSGTRKNASSSTTSSPAKPEAVPDSCPRPAETKDAKKEEPPLEEPKQTLHPGRFPLAPPRMPTNRKPISR